MRGSVARSESSAQLSVYLSASHPIEHGMQNFAQRILANSMIALHSACFSGCSSVSSAGPWLDQSQASSFEQDRHPSPRTLMKVPMILVVKTGLAAETAETRREKDGPTMTHNDISGEIVDVAIAVHKALGPGLLESAYQHWCAFELRSRGLEVETEVPLPIMYRDRRLDVGCRLDLVVENS
jgi:hypothetical protein